MAKEKQLRTRWKGDSTPPAVIKQATQKFNAQFAKVVKARAAFEKEVQRLSQVAWRNLPLDDAAFPDEIEHAYSGLEMAIMKYDDRMSDAVNQYLHGAKRATGAMMRKKPRHLTAMQMTPQKKRGGKRKNPDGLRGTKSEEFMRWFTQGITLGLVRYDGTVLEWPDAKRFVDWWLHAYTLGIVKTEKPIGIEKGASILDYIARRFTIGLVGYGGEPTQVVTRTNPLPGKFADWTDKQLMQEAQDDNNAVHGQSSGPMDFKNLAGSVKELESRGYKITGEKNLKFSRVR